jgi:hypothetical protein
MVGRMILVTLLFLSFSEASDSTLSTRNLPPRFKTRTRSTDSRTRTVYFQVIVRVRLLLLKPAPQDPLHQQWQAWSMSSLAPSPGLRREYRNRNPKIPVRKLAHGKRILGLHQALSMPRTSSGRCNNCLLPLRSAPMISLRTAPRFLESFRLRSLLDRAKPSAQAHARALLIKWHPQPRLCCRDHLGHSSLSIRSHKCNITSKHARHRSPYSNQLSLPPRTTKHLQDLRH